MLRHDRDDVGSPPLTRGKGETKPQPEIRRGITPAYAGKSVETKGEQNLNKDHPRLRGKKRNGDIAQTS